ncbi:MAG: hypothetical protein E6937_02015 [Staphylococcus epidermidis]|nr:hypothetical protein [Staphylococcus epidermidis]
MELTLLDLDCILISKEIHIIELNEERKVLTTDELYDLIHSKELSYADLVEDNFIYIKFNNKDELIILYSDDDMLEVA